MLRLAPLVPLTFLVGVPFPAQWRAPLLSSSGEVSIVSSERTPPLEAPVLALAWLDDARLAVLSPGSVSVHRLDRSRLLLIARRELPGPLSVVRRPGGLILPGDDAFWVLTSGMTKAVLYALERQHLAERAQADALPWPDFSDGLRYREGTNLLETSAGLLLTPSIGGVAIDPSGRLLLLSSSGPLPSGLRAGSALAPLGDGLLAASSPAPPGSPDSLQIVERRGDELHLRTSFPVFGSVRALGARRLGTDVRLAAALETAPGETVVLVLGLRVASS